MNGRELAHMWAHQALAHMWAHQARESARASNLYFEGASIYSYGSHFEIARIVDSKRGKVVLFTTRDYSMSTSRHKTFAGAACHHMTRFYVENPGAGHKSHLKEYRERINALAQRAATARKKKPELLNGLTTLVMSANQYAETFGLQTRFVVPSDIDLTKLREQAKAEEEKNARQAKRRAELAEQRRQKNQQIASQQLENWLAGRPIDWRYGSDANTPTERNLLHELEYAYARVEGDELVTTLGARVPLDHVQRAIPIVVRLIERGEGYHRNGHTIHLGHYALDSIDTAGTVRAGCHTFQRAEVERIGKLLEALPAPAELQPA